MVRTWTCMSMKRKLLGLMFVLVAGTPAMAAINAGDPNRDEHPRRETASYERLLEGTSRNDVSRDEAASLPLECRGYYLQQKSQRASSALSRCE